MNITAFICFSFLIRRFHESHAFKTSPDGSEGGAFQGERSEFMSDHGSTIKFTTNRMVTGLEYLGSGFDAVRSNTLGSIDNGEDLGHRAPIIDFYWSRSDVGVTNSLDWLQPVGGWVRPIIACGESEAVEESSTSSSNEDIIQVAVGGKVAVVGDAGGTLNVGYNDASKQMKNGTTKVHKSSYYCFTYSAGMPPYLNWETTDEFKIERGGLPKDAAIFDKCTISLFKKRSKVCDGVFKWTEFFDLFGTHVTTEIHLGGRITRFLTAPTKAIESFSKSGFNVEAAISAIISGALVNVKGGLDQAQQEALEKLNESCELRFSVLGGIHVANSITPTSLLKWKATVPNFPMPIKMTVTSMDVFLGDEYEHAYQEALNFYVSLHGALPWLVQQHNGFDFNVKSMVMSSTQEVVAGGEGGEIKLECTANKRVLFGFILEYDTDAHTFKVHRCTSNRTCSRECSRGNQAVIWALCGNAMGLNIIQHAQDFAAKADHKVISCKSNYTFLTGFSLVTSPNDKPYIRRFEACATGDGKCGVNGEFVTSIWGVCVDERFPGLERTITLATSSTSSRNAKFGEKDLLLSGFRAVFGKVMESSVCERYTAGCTLAKFPEGESFSLGWGIFHTAGK